MAGHRIADRLQERLHGCRPPDAVEPHNVRAGIFKPLASLRGRDALAHQTVSVQRKRDDGGLAGLLHDLQRRQRLGEPAECFADDEIDVGFRRPTDLLLEHGPRLLMRLGIVDFVNIRVADIAGEQAAELVRHATRDRERIAVHRLEQIFLADQTQLFAVGIIGKRLDDVGARTGKIAMKLAHHIRLFEHDLRHERARLNIAAPLQLEEVALGTNDGSRIEPFKQAQLTFPGRC